MPASLTSETAYLYTNIQAPGTRAFWKQYGLDEEISDQNQNLARTSGQPSMRMVDGTETFTLGGSFDGASGTFTCEGTCTVTYDDANRQPDFMDTSWTFTSSINNGVTIEQDDAFLYLRHLGKRARCRLRPA